MTLLVLGSTGQVGAQLMRRAPDAIGVDRSILDFATADATAIERLLEAHQPSHIINAAGYTAVDRAEQEPELAERVNATVPALLAGIAAHRGIRLTHLSTDYVFDGTEAPYTETARTNPLSTYGRTKYAGEQAVLAQGGTVFRLQWTFDVRGNNFYRTIRRLLEERDALTIVADQIGAPTYAGHIAEGLLNAQGITPGLYHMAAAGHTSWHGFACAIAQGIGKTACRIMPITSAEYPSAVSRPKDTRMDTSKLRNAGIALPHWTDGLKEVLDATA